MGNETTPIRQDRTQVEHDAARELDLTRSIARAINRHSRENASNTPDFILAEYLVGCLKAYEAASNERERWHSEPLAIADGAVVPLEPPAP